MRDRCAIAALALLLAACAEEPDALPGDVSPDEGAASAAVTICEHQEGNVDAVFAVEETEGPNGSLVRYECAQACSVAEMPCRLEREAGDASLIFFTVERAAGWLRLYNTSTASRLVFFVEGSAACDNPAFDDAFDLDLTLDVRGDGRATGEHVISRFAASDIGVVSPRFMPGGMPADISTPVDVKCSGWMTPAEARGATSPEVTGRIAQLVRWTHDRIVEDKPFAFVGYSGGALAGFGALYWNDDVFGDGTTVNQIVDYWHFSGGPLGWNLRAACGNPDEVGLDALRCSNDPTILCDNEGSGCEAVLCPDTYELSPLVPDFPKLLDYLSGEPGDACALSLPTASVSAEGLESSAASSVRYSEGTRANIGPMDFTVCGDDRLILDDLELGTGAQAAMIYLHMTGPKAWLLYGDCGHTSATTNRWHWSRHDIPGEARSFASRHIERIAGASW
jgi:hypothetical protein